MGFGGGLRTFFGTYTGVRFGSKLEVSVGVVLRVVLLQALYCHYLQGRKITLCLQSVVQVPVGTTTGRKAQNQSQALSFLNAETYLLTVDRFAAVRAPKRATRCPTSTPGTLKGGALPAILRAPQQDGRPDVHAQSRRSFRYQGLWNGESPCQVLRQLY